MRKTGILSLAVLLLAGSAVGSEELDARLRRIFSSSDFTARRFGPMRWIRGGSAFTTLKDSNIIENETATGKSSVLISEKQLTPEGAKAALAIDDYQWSEDFSRLLIFTNTKKVWRYNTRGDYWVLDRKSGRLRKLGGNAPESSLMFAKFSPDATRVGYVREHNLYIEDTGSGTVRALTSDGSATLINGTSDWVYEEELGLRDGFRWSPDGKNIAFWQFDSTGVGEFSLIDDTDSLYPKVTVIPYPKAGTKNSSVRVGVVPVAGGTPVWIRIPGDPRENYLFRMNWTRDGRLLAGQLSRRQSDAAIFMADAANGSAKEIFHDHDDAWADIPESEGVRNAVEAFDWLQDGTRFVWLSERDGWRHAYAVPLDGGAPVLITRGAQDVMKFEAVDARWIYFTAAGSNATQRYLYRAPLEGGEPARLTPAGDAGTNSYDLSPDCKWAIHTRSRFDEPPVTELVSLPEHRIVRTLEDNAPLHAVAAGATDPPVEFFQVPVAEGVTGVSLDGWMLKPRGFDAAKKYPVIVFVYGEPASTTVVDSWQGRNGLFHRALAADGYIVVSFDNRGTPAPKGREWRKSIYGDVGVLSTQDQTNAVYALARQSSYIDLERVGVWGWSGGGTNTLNLLFRSPDLYRVGVAVAPVPDQKLYDTIYQERYMGVPEENAAGYKAASAINFAAVCGGSC